MTRHPTFSWSDSWHLALPPVGPSGPGDVAATVPHLARICTDQPRSAL